MENSDGQVLNRAIVRRPGVVVAAFLLLVYVLSLAPTVTYWDAGEFLAAIKTLGIPHPPGTPLYILVANVWSKLASPFVGFAYSINLLSALCTAIACGIFARLMCRWTNNVYASIAGGILAGVMSSVWLNANETEVYSPALLMSALLILIANKADDSREPKWLVLLAYVFGLAWSLQLSALVAGPAALYLAFRHFRDRKIPMVSMVIAAAIGASVVLFMLVRAQHDPGIDQGNPATWNAFTDVLTRKQYLPASFFPRQAPWYLQIGNLFEYADWQFALGLHPEAPPSIARTSFTILYAALGIVGFVWHKRTHNQSWRVLTLLFVCGSLGVVAYLNMKASPSYGFGFLPPNAKHEARERDYFFTLGFLCWGLWAGAGAVCAMSRIRPKWAVAGLAIAILPAFLNFSATNRRALPEASAPRDSALRILSGAPPRAVVFAYGDNDTYPVWYEQEVEGQRDDVRIVTIPLLGAEWYRAELARRDSLMSQANVDDWHGYKETMKDICLSAHRLGRPVQVQRVRDRADPPPECL